MRHLMRCVRYSALALLFLSVASTSARALTIIENTAGTIVPAFAAVFGQSVTTGVEGPWDNIGFSFLGIGGVSNAVGNAIILDAEYTGTPAALSSSTPGFIAESTAIVVGVWIFDPSVVLQPDTQYFIYGDTRFVSGQVFGGPDVDLGGIAYVANQAGDVFAATPGRDNSYRLTGEVVPEPNTASLVGIGLICVAVRRRLKAD